MKGILLDENMPGRLKIPTDLPVIHVASLGESSTDREIWLYAKAHGLVILTKYADFSFMIATENPPPRVVHLRLGNMRLQDLKNHVQVWWPKLEKSLKWAKLIHLYSDRIEIYSDSDNHGPA